MRATIFAPVLSITNLAHGYSQSSRAYLDLRAAEALSPGSTTLLGDLATRDTSTLTTTGTNIKSILSGSLTALADASSYKPPGSKGSSACKKDTCCIWSYIVADMKSTFSTPGACNSLARGAIRQGFHDAAAWNVSLPYGGADGSLLLSGELGRSENLGLQAIAAQTYEWWDAYKQYGIAMADLIQLGAITATAVCPGGPRVRAFVGRQDSSRAPPPGLLPSAFSGARKNIALFEAKTFSAGDLVALVGAHTTSQQFFADPSRAGESQDSTDGVWDVRYYGETQSPVTPKGVFKFPSDVSLSNYSVTKGLWSKFAGNKGAWVQVS